VSKNKDQELGYNYSLFATTDGEVFSGAGTQPRDKFVDWLAEEFAKCVKDLTDENPNRAIILLLDTSLPKKGGWIYHTLKISRLAPLLIPLGRIFNRMGYWLLNKVESGEWKEVETPPFLEE